MIRPFMRWRDRQTLFRNVILPDSMMSGKLFAIGSCFAENVVGVLKKRQVDARMSAAGLFYTPGSVAAYLEALSTETSTLTIFGAGNNCYAAQMESRQQGSEATLHAIFSEQIKADRACLAEAENVVVTLGLNEQIVVRREGAEYICRQMPPVSIQKQLGDQIAVHVWTVAEIKQSLAEIVEAVRTLNPDANMLFTVSPVPLHATFQSHDIHVSNARSKYSLYAALHEFLDENRSVFYFPSFEHAQILQMGGGFWEDDGRHVSSQGVETLMQYLASYSGDDTPVRNERVKPASYDLKRSLKKTVKRGLKVLGLAG